MIYNISFSSSSWVFKKTEISEKIFNKAIKAKYHNFILVAMLFLFMFSLEYGKQLLNELYGRDNLISVAFAGILGPIYVNFVPFMFKKR